VQVRRLQSFIAANLEILLGRRVLKNKNGDIGEVIHEHEFDVGPFIGCRKNFGVRAGLDSRFA
jgi:hypothetical protein